MLAGDRTVLRCAGSSPLVSWTRVDAKGSWRQAAILVSNCELNPLHESVFDVKLRDGSEGGCDLVVKNASVVDAAMYICNFCGGFDSAQSAQLAVLGGFHSNQIYS